MVREDEITRLEYLGQKWSREEPEIRDWACNIHADKIVAIDILIEHTKKGSKKHKLLKIIREIILKQGKALYIQNADPFTNLCIKVGSSLRRAKFKNDRRRS